MNEKHRYIQQGLGYRQIGRFPILKQDKHVRKRPEFTAPGNAGRKISRSLGRFREVLQNNPKKHMCLISKICVPRLFGEFFRTPSIIQKGLFQNGRKFAVEGREIAP